MQQLPQEVPAVQLAQAQFQKTKLAESSMGKSKEDERKSQNAWILGYLDQEDGSDADSAVVSSSIPTKHYSVILASKKLASTL